MLEVRIVRGIGEPTGQKLVEKLEELGVDVRGTVGTGSSLQAAAARVYWGLPGVDYSKPALNKNACTYNKLNELEKLDSHDVPHPRFWHRPPEAESLYPILGRQFAHSEGNGIRIYNNPEAAEGAYNDYYTKVIPSSAEWRVWVFRNQVLGAYKRNYTPDRWPVQRQGFGRNWWNGYGYDLDYTLSEDAQGYAKKAIKAMKLDFGGVDLIQGENGRFYVLEVNTAPGASSFCQTALGKLAQEIKRWYDDAI